MYACKRGHDTSKIHQHVQICVDCMFRFIIILKCVREEWLCFLLLLLRLCSKLCFVDCYVKVELWDWHFYSLWPKIMNQWADIFKPNSQWQFKTKKTQHKEDVCLALKKKTFQNLHSFDTYINAFTLKYTQSWHTHRHMRYTFSQPREFGVKCCDKYR